MEVVEMVPMLYRLMPAFGAMYMVIVTFVCLVCHTIHHSLPTEICGTRRQFTLGRHLLPELLPSVESGAV
jgi:hypothetical protein